MLLGVSELAIGAGLTVIALVTELNVTGVLALSTAITLNVTMPLLEAVNSKELNVIILDTGLPLPESTMVLYVLPGTALAPFICRGIVLLTSTRFAVIGRVPPFITTL